MKFLPSFFLFCCLVQVLGQNGACQIGWRLGRQNLLRAIRAWNNSRCYDFTYFRGCFCPVEYTGPFEVSVRGGVVVSPANVDDIPTVPGLFNLVSSRCYRSCPEQGPYNCNATYAQEGYVTKLDYDGSELIADDETYYVISDFTFC